MVQYSDPLAMENLLQLSQDRAPWASLVVARALLEKAAVALE